MKAMATEKYPGAAQRRKGKKRKKGHTHIQSVKCMIVCIIVNTSGARVSFIHSFITFWVSVLPFIPMCVVNEI